MCNCLSTTEQETTRNSKEKEQMKRQKRIMKSEERENVTHTGYRLGSGKTKRKMGEKLKNR